MKKILSAMIAVMMILALLLGSACAEVEYSYDDIFVDRMIIPVRELFLMRDYYAYACVTADGVVDNMEFGVEDDVVYEWVETMYVPTEGMNNEEKTELKKNMEDTFAAMDKEKFCTVSTYQMMDYLSVKLEFADLDNVENLAKLAEFGFIENGDELISISMTEESLLLQGYVKAV